ncbi:uncharacterized protein F4822DRAFT_425923 [Hypoxylon trugodes]|uniref:uncharacterized protein n=1 Tax=Hypoxylon trugodes TaxID=326681 RepID=UPI0021A1D218|nr:uncharacterized protein F4822DRAFT_425923 [Hypoxylon trugodes]KAI1392717.1 hypothetical protein F4822DRAFT_425923 [Hypoxylon trugodes]
MSSASQNLAQHVRKEQPLTFLSLAPTTSASYPTAQSIKPAMHPRRSSSQSSVGSLRFLKLGPVHYGEHPGEHKEDYHEVAVVDEQARAPTRQKLNKKNVALTNDELKLYDMAKIIVTIYFIACT